MKFLKLLCLSIISINIFFSPLTSTAATTTTQISPTQRFNITHDLNSIFSKFRSYGTNDRHFKLFDELIKNEGPGFFGYHGARRDFRIFQDIIRIAMEEILQIPIRPDFQFFRVPGDPKQNVGSAKQFLVAHNYDVFDDYPLEGQQILSLNIALYEYYWNDTNCCVYFFVNDSNWAKHSYEEKIKPFFLMIGIDPVYINEAFNIGRTTLNGSAALFQLFDASGYKMLNDQAYPSHISGRVYSTTNPPSEYIENNSISNFPQLRLMMDNQYSLNPFSFLIVKRYDLNTPEAVATYEKKLRKYIQTLPVDIYQKEIYRAQLLKMWGN